jgi:8-hydroxy-5-deazaflavin:NADPH oxidoreductase
MSNQDDKLMITVAVLGGTGKEGSGLALRWAHSGYNVIIGSRSAERAAAAAAELNEILGGQYLTGMDNEEATAKADLVVLSVPYDAQNDTLAAVREHLAGKILVSVTVPLMPPKVRQVYLPPLGAAVLESQELLQNDNVRIVGAFQNVSSSHLKELSHSVDCDILVCSDDEAAKEDVIKLVEAAGMRGIDAGPLVNSIAVEALTPVLLYINRKYKVVGSGIRITGIA